MSRSSTGRRPRRQGSGPKPAGGKEKSKRYQSQGSGRFPLLPVGAVVLLLAVAVALFFYVRSSGSPSTPQATNAAVDGIKCDTSEQVAYHIHAHLAIYVNGKAQTVPQGIGIGQPWQQEQTQDGPYVAGGSCLYWLHSHDTSGIIHVESPVQRTYTLGNFFDVWHEPLGTGEVGNARGKVVAYVNGQPYTGNPRNIPLDAHNVIQLDVGDPNVPPAPYTFPPNV